MSGEHLSDYHTRKLADVPLNEFIPQNKDLVDLMSDFTLLATKILVKNIPALKSLTPAVLWHIPHQYTREMSQKSQQV